MSDMDARWDAIVAQQRTRDLLLRGYETVKTDANRRGIPVGEQGTVLAMWHAYERAQYTLDVMRIDYDRAQRELLTR